MVKEVLSEKRKTSRSTHHSKKTASASASNKNSLKKKNLNKSVKFVSKITYFNYNKKRDYNRICTKPKN